MRHNLQLDGVGEEGRGGLEPHAVAVGLGGEDEPRDKLSHEVARDVVQMGPALGGEGGEEEGRVKENVIANATA